jgi:pimeloyl-ACP methyl ester carboxylesterase
LQRKDNGKKLYFTKCSCPDSYADRNILLIHGITSSQHVWDINYKDYSVVRYLARNGYTVWRVDIGGYGKSDKYENGFDVTTLNASKDILTAMEKIRELQGVEKVNVMGWSWGSMTTGLAAESHPEYFRKMVWIGPCFGGTLPKTEVTEPFSPLSYPYVVLVFQHMPGSADDVDYDTIEPEVVGMWCDHVFKIDGCHGRPNGGFRELMGNGDGWLIHPDKIKVPTCIMTGDIDRNVSQERCRIALAKLPGGSELNVFHGAGHALYCETDHYIPFREKALAFLNR